MDLSIVCLWKILCPFLLGLIYTSMVLGSSMMIRRPPPGYLPQGYVPPQVKVNEC